VVIIIAVGHAQVIYIYVFVRALLGYNESVDATIKNVFATAAMRFGHTFLPATVRRADDQYRVINGSQTPLSQVPSCNNLFTPTTRHVATLTVAT